MSINTLSELFLVTAKHERKECLFYKEEGEYKPIYRDEFVSRVTYLAKALSELGVKRGDKVALMCNNRPEWPIVDFACLSLGAALVPVYPTLLPEGAVYIIRNSDSKVVFVEGKERLEGILELSDQLEHVKEFVVIGEKDSVEKAVSFDQFVARGQGASWEWLEGEAKKTKRDELATIIYTSGTTGVPKGVMLSHWNITSNVVNTLKIFELDPSFVALSFLPLSHAYERMVNYIYFFKGIAIAYAESVQTIAQNLQEIRPHVFVSVPRVYEKVHARIYENIAKSSPIKQKLFNWAVNVGKEALDYRLKQSSPGGLLGLKLSIADRLVFSKIRERLGGRFQFAMSGGGPLSKDLAEFFWAAGIRIYEGYGLTETSPVLTVNTPDAVKLGTVGKPIPETEIKIADDGEILAKGPQVMQGYYKMPDATAEVIDDDGWFHTGDIGEIDEDGFVKITDRKKEIIVNAYGKNIAPAPIENMIKSSFYISQAVVIGDRRKFLSALLVPDFEAIKAWAARVGKEIGEANEDIVKNSDVRELIASEVEKVNLKLANYEQIKAWELVPHEFTIEGGELTPTQKVKRRVINVKYKELIESMYSE